MRAGRLTIAFLAALFAAGGAQARSYDCADPASAPEGVWTATQEQHDAFVADLRAVPDGPDGEFMKRICPVIENGEQVFMIGALHVVDDFAVCDDPANYAMFYDPDKRSFGDRITGQTFCARGMKIARPHE